MQKNTSLFYTRLTCFLFLLPSLVPPAMSALTLRLDGNDYTQLGDIHFTSADRTIHVTSLADQQPLICAPVGASQENPGGSLTLRLDSVDYPLSGNVEITRISGNTLVTATSVTEALVCNPNANDAIYQHGFD